MITRQQIIEDIKGIISEHLGIPESTIAVDSQLLDLNFDSLDVVELGLVIDEKYGLDIDAEDRGDFNTVEDIVNCVEKLMQTSASPRAGEPQ